MNDKQTFPLENFPFKPGGNIIFSDVIPGTIHILKSPTEEDIRSLILAFRVFYDSLVIGAEGYGLLEGRYWREEIPVGDKLIVAGKILAIIGATNQGIPLEEVSENIKIVKPEDGE